MQVLRNCMKCFPETFSLYTESKEDRPRTIVDVGCGIGGSARYLARKYEAKVKAVTLSPVQVERATDITAKQGLSDKVMSTKEF